MSRIVRTSLSGSAELDLPYRFICNYCGRQNDKLRTTTVFGAAARRGRVENAAADPMFRQALENNIARSAEAEVQREEQRLADFAARLREGRLLEPVQGVAGKYIPTLPYDGVCRFCGRRQAWDLRALQEKMPPMPAKTEPKWKGVVRIAALILMLPVALGFMLLAINSALLPPKTAALAAAACFVVGLGTAIGLSPNHVKEAQEKLAYEAKYLAGQIAGEPNKPECLPVIVGEAGSDG